MKEWAMTFSIEKGEQDQIERILDKFIEAVEDEGLSCGGSIQDLIPCACDSPGCFNSSITIGRNSRGTEPKVKT